MTYPVARNAANFEETGLCMSHMWTNVKYLALAYPTGVAIGVGSPEKTCQDEGTDVTN